MFHRLMTGFNKERPLYALSMMALFFALFEGLISYIAPILITERHFSKTTMGLILSSSALAGLLFDFVLCRVLSNTHFRRMFILMFICSLIFPLILWQAQTVWWFLLAAAFWGGCFDLFNYGTLDYVGRFVPTKEHVSSFGVLRVFDSLGYLLAPLFAGLVIVGGVITIHSITLALIFLAIAFIFFVVLALLTKSNYHDGDCVSPGRSLKKEIWLWRKVGKFILPVLVLTLALNIIDSFYWTVGPLLSESFSGMQGWGGLFMAVYLFPPLIVGWFVGSMTNKLGKKRTAFLSLLIGSILLASLILWSEPFWLVLVNFLASFFIALAWPAVNGAYADYIHESGAVEKEIESLNDLFTNLGYIIGPVLAGCLADYLGNLQTFSLLGAVGVITALVLFKVTPKKINVAVSV